MAYPMPGQMPKRPQVPGMMPQAPQQLQRPAMPQPLPGSQGPTPQGMPQPPPGLKMPTPFASPRGPAGGMQTQPPRPGGGGSGPTLPMQPNIQGGSSPDDYDTRGPNDRENLAPGTKLGGQGAPTLQDQLKSQWAAIEESMSGGLDSQLRDVDRQTSVNARRATEMNALGGGGVGGAFNAGQAQAQLGGMAMRQNAVADNMKRQVEARMAYLQMLQNRYLQAAAQASNAAEAQKNRDAAAEIAANQDEMSLEIAKLTTG